MQICLVTRGLHACCISMLLLGCSGWLPGGYCVVAQVF